MKSQTNCLFVLVLSASTALSQNVKDSLLFAPLVSVSVSGQIPGGDMAKRYGSNGAAGFNFSIKSKRNFIYGVNGYYLFGKEIKEDLFKNIATVDGFIIGNTGLYADVKTYERGISLSTHAGKVFPIWGPNKNSGVIGTAGLGYLQHKVKIVASESTVPELAGDYKKGYDKLTNGISLSEFLGYLFLGNRRTVNFFGGFEFMQAFTKSRRSYDFTIMGRDTRNRIDLFYGFRLGWILPLYKRVPNDFYLY